MSANLVLPNSENLVYITKLKFWNVGSMPPGVYGKIFAFRKAHYGILLADFLECRAPKLLLTSRFGAPTRCRLVEKRIRLVYGQMNYTRQTSTESPK